MLSSSASAMVEVDSLMEGLDFACNVTKAKFEALNMDFFNKCIKTVEQVLKDAKLNKADIDDVVLVGGSTRIPKMQQMLVEYFDGKELCKSINPDEAVAYGAAVQGAILSGVKSDETKGLLLVDVTPLSLGIETVGKVMSTIIKRNTPIPCSKSDIFTTEEDFQTQVDVVVYEGERQCTEGNNKLGDFEISGLEHAKRGVPKVEVRFDLDANGILNVTARDQVTGAEAAVTITNSTKQLDQEEIAHMVAEAERFKEEDAERVAVQEAKSNLEMCLCAAKERAENTGDRDMMDKIQSYDDWLENARGVTRAELERRLHSAQREFF
jgi:L1 cell adhesion molecule like protein